VPRAPERIGNGLDTYIYSFNVDGAEQPDAWAKPLILRVYPAASQSEKARREFAVQQFAVDCGFLAPRPLPPAYPGTAQRPHRKLRIQGTASWDF